MITFFAAFGILACGLLLVAAWFIAGAILREDRQLTLTDPPRSRRALAVRWLTGLHTVGYDDDDVL